MRQKAVISDSTAIAANTTENNILSDTEVTNVPTDDNYLVEFLASGSATGLRHTFKADLDTAVIESGVSTQNRVPIRPDDIVDRFMVQGGSKLFLKVENTTAGSLTYFYTVILTPASML